MPVEVICGLQWGDEGKGKITHMLSSNADYVCRYAGGPNSGHTIITGGNKFVFHVIPAGIFKPGVKCLIGPGTVIDPMGFCDELAGVESNIPYEGRLFLSHSAHMILEYHRYQDKLDEEAKGKGKLGTTLRGIGPAYSDKVNRIGIKMGLLDDEPRLVEAIRTNLERKNKLFTRVYDAPPLELDKVVGPVLACKNKILPLIANTTCMANKALAEGKRLLMEGNQGVLLDIDHGTFPFVTSSSCVPASGLATFGVSPKYLTRVIGVAKAYQTRVGKGPMPTLQDNEIGRLIRERGREYGSSTGRPRDCGFLDLVALKYSVLVSGVNFITLTLLDVLDAFDEIKVCTAYKTHDGKEVGFVNDDCFLKSIQPVYTVLPGWRQDIGGCKTFDSLPENAKGYAKFIEDFVGVPVGMVSVGPEESQTIRRKI